MNTKVVFALSAALALPFGAKADSTDVSPRVESLQAEHLAENASLQNRNKADRDALRAEIRAAKGDTAKIAELKTRMQALKESQKAQREALKAKRAQERAERKAEREAKKAERASRKRST